MPASRTARDALCCTVQIVRWQLYTTRMVWPGCTGTKWNETISTNAQYETGYYFMMQYLVGGKFSGPCSFTAGGGSSTWACTFIEADGTSALCVWAPNEGGIDFMVPASYVDYRDLSGGTTTLAADQQIIIGPEPFMLEQ